ncbi:MAG TPA: lysozyme inhibitor LprI family protein [Candidatus Angelobacter sp.]|nr:lysozyme inhibitor LprI family protein [Candidatus Angelobacter sp.]
MKIIAGAAVVMFVLFFSFNLAADQKGDPCANEQSNAGMRQCYAREQTRVTAEADLAARKIVTDYRKEALDPSYSGPIAMQLRKAASSVIASQKTWKAYRDQHCNAVEYSWTTGSGAVTAHEECMFRLAQKRLHELRADFH